ncbi:MAG TPA: hypothetical protein VN442_11570 [Bryobacteraceae bacterium]|nr:hypothetical protein [Bryobacteraceae bacterium]
MVGLRREDVAMAIEGNGVELRKQSLGTMTVAFVRAQRGTDLRPVLKGLPDDLCHCAHWGYVLKGKVRMYTKTGHHDYEAGQAFYWAPGHAPEMLEDSEYVDFSPTRDFDEVIQHIKRQAQAG